MINNVITITGGKDLFASPVIPQKEVFGQFIHEGELCVLFGDSSTGKSILSNDIAFFVSGGINHWGPEFVSPNIPSMYIDMEMTQQQFMGRYIGAKNIIPNTYSRAEVNVVKSDDETILQAVVANIIARQASTDAPKFIIIDNITNGFGNIHSAPAMKSLITTFKNLKDRFALTILIIAHCPKRKRRTEITGDNLGGSKMILNFVDSAFAIAPSIKGNDIRYVKQIKSRTGRKLDNVATIVINDTDYVHFEFVEWTDEQNHIVKIADGIEFPPPIEAAVLDLYLKGVSYDLIAKKTKQPKWKIIEYIIQQNLLQ